MGRISRLGLEIDRSDLEPVVERAMRILIAAEAPPVVVEYAIESIAVAQAIGGREDLATLVIIDYIKDAFEKFRDWFRNDQ